METKEKIKRVFSVIFLIIRAGIFLTTAIIMTIMTYGFSSKKYLKDFDVTDESFESMTFYLMLFFVPLIVVTVFEHVKKLKLTYIITDIVLILYFIVLRFIV